MHYQQCTKKHGKLERCFFKSLTNSSSEVTNCATIAECSASIWYLTLNLVGMKKCVSLLEQVVERR